MLEELTWRKRRGLMTPRASAADDAMIDCEKCGCWHDARDDCRWQDLEQVAVRHQRATRALFPAVPPKPLPGQ